MGAARSYCGTGVPPASLPFFVVRASRLRILACIRSPAFEKSALPGKKPPPALTGGSAFLSFGCFAPC